MYEILNVYLKNGLRVVMHRMQNVHTMACGVWVRQGSKHENEKSNGLSHLLEHLMINIDNQVNPKFKELMNEVTSEGVVYNALTTKESTSFFFAGLSDSLGKCISTLASIVADNKVFPQDIVENEKKVVIQEAVSFYSSFNQIKERISQALWGDIGVGKIIVGSIENIKSSTISELEEIIRGAYTPENSAIVIIGDIDYEETLRIVELNFSNWEDRNTREYDEVVDSEPGIYYNQGGGGKSTIVSIGFRTPGYMHSERMYIDVFSKILGDTSFESRLMKEIRIKKGLAYNLGTFTNFYENRGTFAFTALCAKESIEELVKIACDELNKAISYGFTQVEMERAKRILKTNRLLEIGDIASQLKFLGKCVSYGHLYSLEQELRNIEKVNLDVLNKVIKEVAKPNNYSVAIIGDCDIDKVMSSLYIS